MSSIQHTLEQITIRPATLSEELPQAGLQAGETVYLAWDSQVRLLYTVRWERIRWVCSCGTKACAHQIATNTSVFDQMMSRTRP